MQTTNITNGLPASDKIHWTRCKGSKTTCGLSRTALDIWILT